MAKPDKYHKTSIQTLKSAKKICILRQNIVLRVQLLTIFAAHSKLNCRNRKVKYKGKRINSFSVTEHFEHLKILIKVSRSHILRVVL